MDYWGGAAPGSGKCECGLTEVGCAGTGVCNCDSKLNETDEGQIQHKDHLPILELHFGDTGTAVDDKIGFHKVDKLECRGDSKYRVMLISVLVRLLLIFGLTLPLWTVPHNTCLDIYCHL